MTDDSDQPSPDRGAEADGSAQGDGSKGGTPQYLSSTGEYSPTEGDHPSPRDDERPKEREWWERAGYSSLAEAFADERAMEDRVWGREPRDLGGLSVKEILFSKPERPSRRGKNRRSRGRQVNIKLTDEEHADLTRAASAYGLAAATLARAFVVRATEVVLEEG